MRRGSTRQILLVLAGLMLAAPTVRGADAPEAGTPAAPAPGVAAPAAIPAREIPERAEATVSALHGLRAVLADDETVERISGEIPSLRDEVERRAGVRIDADSGLSARDLRDIERAWLRVREQLSEWSIAVGRRTADVEKAVTKLQDIEETWRLTAADARRDDLPPALVSEVAAVRTSVTDFGASLRVQRTRLLTLASEIGTLQAKVVDRLADIDAASASQRRSLLSPDVPPLWRAVGQPMRQTAEATWRRKLEQLRSFGHQERDRLLGQLLAIAMVAFLVARVGRRTRQWSHDEEAFHLAAPVIAHPVSAALLVTVVPCIIIYRTDPLVVTETWSLLLAVPLVRLLADRLRGRLRRLVLAPAVVLVVVTLRSLLPATAAGARLLLVVENLALAAWVLWAIPPTRETLSGVARWVLVLSRFALLMLLASVVANLTGRLALALFLTQGLLGNLLLGLGAFGAARVHVVLVVALLHSHTALRLRSIARHAKVLRQRATRVIRFAAVLLWLGGALQLYGLLGPALNAVAGALDARLEIGSLSLSAKDVLAFGLTVWLALVIARLVRAVLEDDVLARMNLPRGVPSAISAAANYVILLFGFFFAMSAAGLDLGRVTLLAGAFGVGIGFGLQNIVNNFVSGLILLFERPIRMGDIIEMPQTIGRVRRIGIRSSTIETPDGAEVIVPNASLISERLTNWTLSDNRRRFEIPVTVAYGSDPNAVLALLKRIAASETEVLPEPPPEAQFMCLGDNGLNFVLTAWTYFDLAAHVRSRVVLALHAALAEAGVEIPFPQREIRVRSADGTLDGSERDRGAEPPGPAPRKPTASA
jgi:small-conductance mechanosensitive channel